MVRDSGGDAVTLIQQGDALFDAGNVVDAEQTLEQATRLDPYNAKAWARLGLVYAARGRHDKAIATYEKAARFGPDDPEPPYNLGVLFAELNRVDDAIKSFDVALSRDPSFDKALFNRGVLRLRVGDTAGGVADLRAFQQLGGDVPDALLSPLATPSEEPSP
jgi:tetratricopeptide (TPR) repeat protein